MCAYVCVRVCVCVCTQYVSDLGQIHISNIFNSNFFNEFQIFIDKNMQYEIGFIHNIGENMTMKLKYRCFS